MRALRAWKILVLGAALLGCSTDDKHPSGTKTNGDEVDDPSVVDTCVDVVDKLTACELISGTHLKDCAEGDRLATCVTACVADASCAQMKAGYCESAFNGFSGCLEECHSAPPPDYLCSDGSSIPASWRCDGGEDCPDGKDEDCPKGTFSCDDGLSVPAAWHCDTVDDCLHGEDELDCPGSAQISCDDGTRLPARRRCDGSADCAEAEDELDCVELRCEQD